MYTIEKQNGKVLYTDTEEKRSLLINEENFMGMFETENPEAVKAENIKSLVVDQPIGCEKLSEIVAKKNAKTACIIVSDATRGVPTAKVAPFILEELNKGGIKDENIVFVVALGVHRDATEDEMKVFVGEEIYSKYRMENHRPFDEEHLVYLGETSRKTPVKVNKTVYESDIVVTVGKVELHDMAGFSGGRKSILPGVSSEETIVINHRPEMMEHPCSYSGNLEGNPIHLDMLETAQMCGVDYTVNVVMNKDYEIAGIFAGELDAAHRKAAEFLKLNCNIALPEKPDVYVVCPGDPLNIDMYQGVKAIIALRPVADETSTVVLYGNFTEGINSTDFVEPFKMFEDLADVKKYVWDNYEIQMDHIIPIRDMLVKGVKFIVVSENVTEEEIKTLRMEKAETLQQAVDMAIAEKDGKARVAICPQSYRGIISIPE